jgi:hypothetical protein
VMKVADGVIMRVVGVAVNLTLEVGDNPVWLLSTFRFPCGFPY